jgi:hypothetical protein
VEFFFSFRSLIPLFSNGLWRMFVSSRYASFPKSICIDLVKEVEYGTGGPCGRAVPVLQYWYFLKLHNPQIRKYSIRYLLELFQSAYKWPRILQKCPEPKSHIIK